MDLELHETFLFHFAVAALAVIVVIGGVVYIIAIVVDAAIDVVDML